jgi:DNA polymerase-3 subunit beta
MKFVISTQELTFLINKIQNIVPLKPTQPILNNFLIEVFNDELVLTATDLTVSIRCNTEASIKEEGATTLPAKKLAQLIRELTAMNVEISTNSQNITTLVAGTSRFKLKGLNKEEYPQLPDLSQCLAFHVKQKDLKHSLQCTSFAVSKEDTRYVLAGILMLINDQLITFVGTDGKRLARAKMAIETAETVSSQAVLPLKAVEEVLKNLTDEGDVKISIMDDKATFEINQTLIVTKLLVGEYPEINRIIPEKSEFLLSLHREELIVLLRQISLFTSEQHPSVRFTLVDGELKLTANTQTIGEGSVEMAVNYRGERLDIAFNPQYFIDILRHCKEETVTLGLIDTFNPGIITDGELNTPLSQASPLFVLMPMRLMED